MLEFPGDVGGIYPSAIQAVLPRLLSAAAPPGSLAQENRRQCMKASLGILLLLLLFFYILCHWFYLLVDVLHFMFFTGFEALAGKKDPSRICYLPSYAGT